MFANRFQKFRGHQPKQLPLELESLEDRMMLSVSAIFVPLLNQVQIISDNGADTITVSRSNAGEILLNGTQVSNATVSNTRLISINSGGGQDKITINQTNGPFEPGLGGETGIREIEFNIDGSGGGDQLTIIGQASDDIIALGTKGINLNGDDDVDVTLANIGMIVVDGRAGYDDINAKGDAVVGTAFSLPLDLRGGEGNDTLNGGNGDDVLNGGNGNDNLFGNDGNDTLRGGNGKDQLFGGAGVDSLFGQADNDALDGGSGFNNTLNGGSGIDNVVFQPSLISLAERFQINVLRDPATNTLLGFISSPSGNQNIIDSTMEASGIEGLTVLSGVNDDVINLSSLTLADAQALGLVSIFVVGNGGNDRILGSGANDQILGGVGDDEIFGNGGNDNLFGGSGNDRLLGGNGNDSLAGGAGDDTLLGQNGDDLLFSNEGNDTVNGGAGSDRLILDTLLEQQLNQKFLSADRIAATGNLVSESRLLDGSLVVRTEATGIESLVVFGSSQDDEIDLSRLSKIALQSLGISTVSAFGQAGNDIIRGSGIADLLLGNEGDDEIFGNAGDDNIEGNAGNDRLFGASGNDFIDGGDGNDLLRGGNGDDILLGGNGNDKLFGEDGNDTLDGGPGNNTLDEGPGQGGIVFYGTSGDDIIRIGRKVIRGQVHVVVEINGQKLVQPYNQGETVIVFAGAGNDRVLMRRSASKNWQAIFHGGEGNDKLRGSNLDDQLYGDAGNDRLFGKQGNDILLGGDGDDKLSGGRDRDLLLGGLGKDKLRGGDHDDILIGGGTTLSDQSLGLLLNEWISQRSYLKRVKNVQQGTGPLLAGSGIFLSKETTVTDDLQTDRLLDSQGRNLYFTGNGDQVNGDLVF
jgi:Ca2+-binding RTX toxin-like protein